MSEAASTAYNKAADDLQRLANMLSGIVALAPGLKQIGSIEQAIEEATTRLRLLRDDIENVKAVGKRELDELTAQLVALKGNISNRTEDLRQAEDKLREMQAGAEKRSREILEGAKHTAALIAAQAKAEAEQAKDGALRELQDNIKASIVEYHDLQAKIADATQTHNRIRSEISKLRERLA